MDIRQWLSGGGGVKKQTTSSKKPGADTAAKKRQVISSDEDEPLAPSSKRTKQSVVAESSVKASKSTRKKDISARRITYIDSSSDEESSPPAKKPKSSSEYFSKSSSSKPAQRPKLASRRETSAASFFGSTKVVQSKRTTGAVSAALTKSIPESPLGSPVQEASTAADTEDGNHGSQATSSQELRRSPQKVQQETVHSPAKARSLSATASPQITVTPSSPRRSPRSKSASTSSASPSVPTRAQEKEKQGSVPKGMPIARELEKSFTKKQDSVSERTTVTMPTKNELVCPPSSSADRQPVVVSAADNDLAPTPPVKRGSSFMQFKNRDGPRAVGSRQVPEGAENCFGGWSFLFTGILESIEREDAQDLVRRYGGKISSTVGKRLNYLVVGREPGPTKIDKANNLNITQLNEDQFFDLIRTSSAKPYASEGAAKSRTSTPSKGKQVQTPNKGPSEEHSMVRNLPQVKAEALQGSSVAPKVKEEETTALMLTPGDVLWVDKYKPRDLKHIIGQQGNRSNMNKLLQWLKAWDRTLAYSGPPNRDTGLGYHAALLSGSPGVGKTTTATLVCQELGIHYVEMNASDTRSKRSLDEVVAQTIDNQTISSMLKGAAGFSGKQRNALLMDEVDGMAGNEDRGGMQELVSLIKHTKMPIICMCNDRNSQKIRTLANYCFDLRFQRPRLEQIRGSLMSIAFKEGLTIKPPALDQIIMAANNDIRQVLHHLYMWSIRDKGLSFDDAKADANKAKKHLKLGPFEVVRKVFSAETGSQPIGDQLDLFFQDYSMVPLFVQENYPFVHPHSANGDLVKTLTCLGEAAELISQADLVEKRIRSNQAWGLLPLQGMFSTVLPAHAMRGGMSSQINFPSWLGNFSRRNRFDRLLQELCVHTRLSASTGKVSMGLDVAPCLHYAITQPLLEQAENGLADSLACMFSYSLLREDVESLGELCVFPPKKEPFASLSPKVKAAFTRAYNKQCPATPYSVVGGKSKSRGRIPKADELTGDGDETSAEAFDIEEELSDDDVSSALVKKKASRSDTKATMSKATSSKGSRGGKAHGKGRM